VRLPKKATKVVRASETRLGTSGGPGQSRSSVDLARDILSSSYRKRELRAVRLMAIEVLATASYGCHGLADIMHSAPKPVSACEPDLILEPSWVRSV
jgi:hypothetical protein